MISPKTATTLLATLALAAFVSAAPLESPDKYGSDITPIDIDGDGKISKWELGQKWQPSAEFFQFILEHQQKSCQQQPQPFYKKRDAAPEAEAEAEADPCFDGSCGKPAYYPEPNQPYYPEPNPPYKPGFLPPNKPGFLPPGKPGFFPPTPQFPPFPPVQNPPAPNGPCSGNTNVAACCSGSNCQPMDHGVLGGLLGLGLDIPILNNACQSNQQLNCCNQQGSILSNCGSLIDIL
ncbi:hypothetical protein MPH_07062 [Macrophomina phaseolina MS6]|uniref:Hydrophobin n=1 Tax=Macrophomina phaseolina (strain MS6) TaxID=1126212 RepID=K2RSD5_MACPH|nr:hypothetical protein MPH_07062 [Macrophomina phaseolina MS6]